MAIRNSIFVVVCLSIYLLGTFACQPATKKMEMPESDEAPEHHLSFLELESDYIADYSNIEEDSLTILYKKNTYQVKTIYYCLFDSLVNVPLANFYEDAPDKFVSHNFEYQIVVLKNKDTILDKKIDKSVYSAELPDDINLYGVLFSPYISSIDTLNSSVNIDCSISIPLTDIGILKSVSISFDDGKIRIVK